MTTQYRHTLQGILLAVLATLVWSGNFIVARYSSTDVPPIMLATLRWSCAALLMLPLGYQAFWRQRQLIVHHWPLLLFASFTGISLFNTLVYVAGHYSEAIMLALVGTTSSPVFSFILARIFLQEKIPPQRLAGLLLCITGILLLLSRGSWYTLLHLRFTEGDWWILGAALSFAIYNILARKKPAALSPTAFLFSTFWMGALLLLPAAAIEYVVRPYQLVINWQLAGIVLYLGLGTSVIAFYCWNRAIGYLGAARAAIFGNLIPIFSSLEAVWLLGEHISWMHVAGMLLVISGLVLANLRFSKQPAASA
ncbi:MAG: DMT family transporter [Chitinophagaceae bacterium]|jgi:drug/metabolite transporter (DMT)-like permease|nr:DMT family transporter [Chitinophagaceae bacterium]